MCASNPYPRELPKTQATSPLAARFQCFSPRWSAVWAPQHRKPRPRRRQSGGIALHGGPTRRRHAARGLRVVQNPRRPPVWRTPVARRARPQYRLARKSSPNTAPPAALPRKSSPSMHKTPNLGQFERAGRTFSRFHDLTGTQGELFRACRRRPSSALPIRTLGPTGMEGTGGPGEPSRSAHEQRQGTAISPPTGTKTTREHNTTLPTRTAPGPSGTKLSPHEPHGPTSGTKLSPLARNGLIWRFFCMQGEFYTVVTTKRPSRENFVPNARQRSS